MEIRRYEDLVQFLKDFRSWGNAGEGYDYVGMIHLLGACLENLRKYASESELAELGECLEAGQIQFMKRISLRI